MFLLRLLAASVCALSVNGAAAAKSCNRDNCFRGLLRASATASAFCATYTQTANTATVDLPKAIASPCGSRPLNISSACSCLWGAGTTSTPTTTTTATSQVITTSPACSPTLTLVGVAEDKFNSPDTPFGVQLSCNSFNTSSNSFAVFIAGDDDGTTLGSLGTLVEGVTISPSKMTIPGIPVGPQVITIAAYDNKSQTVFSTFRLIFGTIDMPVLVLDENGVPVPGVSVNLDSTAYPGVFQNAITDSSGIAQFHGLPPSSVGLFVKTEDNKIGFNGVAATFNTVTLNLLPFYPASNTSDFRVDDGLTGWEGEFQIGNSNLSKRATTLVVGTNGQPDLQKAHAQPKVYPFTKTVFIKYTFITSEVPGGYFGTKYNDYYIVSIRSNTGKLATDSQSMNGLGIGAFDAQGATTEFNLQLKVDPKTQWVQYDVGVSNVADSALQSEVVVSGLGDLTCEQCGSCRTCPGNPICQSFCQSPPPRSCDFYSRCAEEALDCGSTGYPIRYGLKNCRNFEAKIKGFTAQGQAWVWNVMSCLQKALISPIGQCGATCDLVKATAFASHPGCYVSQGVCNLPVQDIVQIVLVVQGDLFADGAFRQVLQTSGACVSEWIRQINALIDELEQRALEEVGNAIRYIARALLLKAIRTFLQQYLPTGLQA